MTPARDLAAAQTRVDWLNRLDIAVDAAMRDRDLLPRVQSRLVETLLMVRALMVRRRGASETERQGLRDQIDRTLRLMDKVDRLVAHHDALRRIEPPVAAPPEPPASREPPGGEMSVTPTEPAPQAKVDPPARVFSLADLDAPLLLAALRLGPDGDGRAPFIAVRNKAASVYRLLESSFHVDPAASETILKQLQGAGALEIRMRGLPPGGEVRPAIFVIG